MKREWIQCYDIPRDYIDTIGSYRLTGPNFPAGSAGSEGRTFGPPLAGGIHLADSRLQKLCSVSTCRMHGCAPAYPVQPGEERSIKTHIARWLLGHCIAYPLRGSITAIVESVIIFALQGHRGTAKTIHHHSVSVARPWQVGSD